MGATTLCVVGWQSAPPEATAVIKAVIEWTHIFISYWFISNSPLISGGHHRTVAFLLPRLRSSAPPDITVVITALPPRKLFTVSYSSKNWMSILEEKSRRKEERGEKTLTEREKSKTASLSPTGVRFDKTELQWAWTIAIVLFQPLIVKVLDLFRAPGERCRSCCSRRKLFLRKWGEACNNKHQRLSGWFNVRWDQPWG